LHAHSIIVAKRGEITRLQHADDDEDLKIDFSFFFFHFRFVNLLCVIRGEKMAMKKIQFSSFCAAAAATAKED
jgi:hypothetical protein